MDFFLSGTNVAKAIMPNIAPDIPVLVHSMNPADASKMVKALSKAGFSVTRLPMSEMTGENLRKWLEEVRECWVDRNE